jgi:uncharacterized C2H2 Zn-finger protein
VSQQRQRARRTKTPPKQNGVRPFERLQRVAADLNYPRQWLAERARFSGLVATLRTHGEAHHFENDRRYGAWCAAAAILSPSLPLVGWPGDASMEALDKSSRHVRRWEAGHQTLIRPIARATVRRFQRLATVAPVQLWLSDLADDSRRKAKRAADGARAKSPELARALEGLSSSFSRHFLPSTSLRGTDDPRGVVVECIWHLLRDPDADRLKKCPRCGTWFTDVSKKLAQVYCSRPCVNQAWSRAARRAAGHKQYRRSRAAKKGNSR